MPGTVENHYATLLADHYDWMFGVSFETKVMEQTVLLKEILGPITGHPVALDLGCGSGFQSVALADLGYSVVAVDMCDKLLTAFNAEAGSAISPSRVLTFANWAASRAPAVWMLLFVWVTRSRIYQVGQKW